MSVTVTTRERHLRTASNFDAVVSILGQFVALVSRIGSSQSRKLSSLSILIICRATGSMRPNLARLERGLIVGWSWGI